QARVPDTTSHSANLWGLFRLLWSLVRECICDSVLHILQTFRDVLHGVVDRFRSVLVQRVALGLGILGGVLGGVLEVIHLVFHSVLDVFSLVFHSVFDIFSLVRSSFSSVFELVGSVARLLAQRLLRSGKLLLQRLEAFKDLFAAGVHEARHRSRSSCEAFLGVFNSRSQRSLDLVIVCLTILLQFFHRSVHLVKRTLGGFDQFGGRILGLGLQLGAERLQFFNRGVRLVHTGLEERARLFRHLVVVVKLGELVRGGLVGTLLDLELQLFEE
uniref:Uncharacterized protein n=1 Tax=Globisporangium ultimum (strain ATCC 200006 / CBS 805.95 / DAOM BR144) TaxID=431595 RepID=K3X4R5_GLOUD